MTRPAIAASAAALFLAVLVATILNLPLALDLLTKVLP